MRKKEMQPKLRKDKKKKKQKQKKVMRREEIRRTHKQMLNHTIFALGVRLL